MKKILFAFSVVIVFASCSKWNGEKTKSLVYYTTDFKEKAVNFLDIPSTEIDAVWFDFAKEGKDKEYTKYALAVKANGTVTKSLGTCSIDWKNKITFTPNSGDKFYGVWKSGKEKYAIDYDLGERTESVIFIYKKQKHKCGKHK